MVYIHTAFFICPSVLSLIHICHKYHMPLFMDGARLGYGLAAEGTDVRCV